jgi:hypothetical protein
VRRPAVWTANLASLLFGIGLYSATGYIPSFLQTPRGAGYGFSASISQSGTLTPDVRKDEYGRHRAPDHHRGPAPPHGQVRLQRRPPALAGPGRAVHSGCRVHHAQRGRLGGGAVGRPGADCHGRPGAVLVHHLFSDEIDVDSAASAHAVIAMEDLITRPASTDESGQARFTSMHGYGHYRPRFTKENGRWYIAELVLTRLRIDLTY